MNSNLRRPYLLSLSILASAMIVAGCAEPAAQEAPASVPEVSVVTVEAGPVSLTSELAGRTSPFMVSEVRPQVGGIVKKRSFVEGSDVKAGDTLYEIDPATYKANHNSAKAALAKAEANLKVARLTSNRYKELVKINAVSRQDNDRATAEMLQAQADVASAKAALDMAAINLGYTRVTAPISGRIGQSSITPGALLSANQTSPLATIQQLDPIYVDVTQSSVELMRLRRALASGSLSSTEDGKANVKLVLEDGTLYAHPGKLQFSDVSVDIGTGMVRLRAVFPNPEQHLLPGMYVRAVLEEGVRHDAILVPQKGVTRDAKGNATALVLNAADVVEARVLKTSRTVGDQWLVDDGIKAGERLIVEGVQKVRPGTNAQVAEQQVADPAAGKGDDLASADRSSDHSQASN
ncbi:efflux RND transporter periplasmic adaptor subunit [Candidimonas sp. SYP-B2681]|uniref:efflux RND transporter periplasmic adaptor subunit n=1 Tax=Candidimonas sp. SYP-B2681 TaxID=2497686 RepID=UPI000F87EDED|nr:efflux RND transporter periplasmic adaptor subunit [Candidimonas sp. SYP-B2681]RTZ47958.1 efflux RND transporter periplasmic adaptor subunit [Candidimonas sp. SYP-B2681]